MAAEASGEGLGRGRVVSSWRWLTVPPVIGAAVGLAAVGCERPSSDGTGRVQSSEPELVLEITGPDEDGRAYFGATADLFVAGAGRLYVLDRPASRVTEFSPEGLPIASFGGPGEGPGEFGDAARLLAGPGGEVLVGVIPDQLVRFSRDGSYIGTIRLPVDDRVCIDLASTEEGTLLVECSPGGVNQAVERRGRWSIGILDPQEGSIETMVPLARDETRDDEGTHLLAPRPLWALGRDGRLVVTTSASSRIEVLALDGTVQGVIELSGAPAVVSGREKGAILAAAREVLNGQFERAGLPTDMVASLMEGLDVADTYPLFTRVFLGPRQTVWLLRPTEIAPLLAEGEPIVLGEDFDEDFGVRGTVWDVYDGDGRAIDEIRFPAGFEPLSYLDGRIYGVHTDDLGVQKVQVYALRTLR